VLAQVKLQVEHNLPAHQDYQQQRWTAEHHDHEAAKDGLPLAAKCR